MCGISAIVKKDYEPVFHDELHRMNDKVKHRGPDGEGIFIDRQVGLGHRLLRITGLNGQNHQPMFFKDLVLIYNGEIYNYLSLKKELIKDGYRFQTDTDSEVILAAYDKWKESCTAKLHGMWAFVLYDIKNRVLFCSRDRFGIKPLFYTLFNNKLLIGSEIKQFTVFDDFQARLNHRIACRFMSKAKPDLGNESFFENVKALPPGHNLLYHLPSGKMEIKKWYRIAIPENKFIDMNEAIAEFRSLFFESVEQHSKTSVPLGTCLSGGLDSTAIIGTTKFFDHSFTGYSSCFSQKHYNEIHYVDEVSAHYRVPTHKIFPDINQLLENELLEKIVYHQDQPIFGGSYFSEYKVFETAGADNIRVMLSGQGADEYLGGYREFFHAYLVSMLRKVHLQPYIGGVYQGLLKQNFGLSFFKELACYAWMGLTRKQVKFLPVKNVVSKECFRKKWLEEYSYPDRETAYRNFHDLSVEALLNYSLPHQLHSEDRNSMMHSIESRLPFLDHRLVEFCISLPDRFKIHKGIIKVVLRKSLKNILPPKIYHRLDKLGFPGPEESLFKEHSKEVRKRLQDCVNEYSSVFDAKLLKYFDAYINRKISYDPVFFRILSFGAWAKRFNIRTASAHVAIGKAVTIL